MGKKSLDYSQTAYKCNKLKIVSHLQSIYFYIYLLHTWNRTISPNAHPGCDYKTFFTNFKKAETHGHHSHVTRASLEWTGQKGQGQAVHHTFVRCSRRVTEQYLMFLTERMPPLQGSTYDESNIWPEFFLVKVLQLWMWIN